VVKRGRRATIVSAMSNIVHTACNRDCPDACALLVTVEDGRAVRLAGDPDDPVTKGFLCERTSRFLTRQYDPRRITSPLLRHKGELVEVSWDEALDVAAEKLLEIRERLGPAAIMHYRSGGSLGLLKAMPDLLFERFGPVTIKRGDICSGAGEFAQELDFGQAESHDLLDLLHAKVIVLWGKDPHTTGVHLLPVLRQAAKAGAVIVGVDPLRTRAAELCELFIQPRPGGDAALALCVAAVLFERGWADPSLGEWADGAEGFAALAASRTPQQWADLAGVPFDQAMSLAEIYGRADPAALLVGWGLGRRRNGAATVRVLDALGAAAGHIGVAGGGVSYYFGRRTPFDTGFVRGLEAAPRTLSEARLGAELLAANDPAVAALWVTAGNPVSMLPDAHAVRRGIAATEFSVVVDTHPTDTTDVADLVLPTLTLLEDSDVLGSYGHHWLRSSRQAVAPPPGPRHELEIVQGLAARLGLADVLAGTVDDWKARLTQTLSGDGATIAAMEAGPVRNPFVETVLYADKRFPTASGKASLITTEPELPAQGQEGFPLILMACSTPKGQSSQWSVEIPEGPPSARVHPDVAAPFAGQEVELVSHLGALAVRLVPDDAVRPDMVVMAKGGMLRDGRCANALISAVETDLGGGAAYHDEPVALRVIGGEA